MPRYADRVKETTTTTGTGALVLAGAVSQFQSFATAFASASVVVPYAIVGQTGTEWETGLGTFNGTTGLTRDIILASSNSNAVVNLSAGTKDVFVTFLAEHADNSNVGFQLAMSCGMAMP